MEIPQRSQWGPVVWNLIHWFAVTYPEEPEEEDKQRAKVFFESLPQWLWCEECRGHFKDLLKEYDIAKLAESRKDLIDLTHELHNKVNQRLKKPEISKQEFYKLYASVDAVLGIAKPRAPPTSQRTLTPLQKQQQQTRTVASARSLTAKQPAPAPRSLTTTTTTVTTQQTRAVQAPAPDPAPAPKSTSTTTTTTRRRGVRNRRVHIPPARPGRNCPSCR